MQTNKQTNIVALFALLAGSVLMAGTAQAVCGGGSLYTGHHGSAVCVEYGPSGTFVATWYMPNANQENYSLASVQGPGQETAYTVAPNAQAAMTQNGLGGFNAQSGSDTQQIEENTVAPMTNALSTHVVTEYNWDNYGDDGSGCTESKKTHCY